MKQICGFRAFLSVITAWRFALGCYFFICFYDFIEMIKMVDLRVGDFVLYSELFLHAKICFKKN